MVNVEYILLINMFVAELLPHLPASGLYRLRRIFQELNTHGPQGTLRDHRVHSGTTGYTQGP